jgi:hypothetical protein
MSIAEIRVNHDWKRISAESLGGDVTFISIC